VSIVSSPSTLTPSAFSLHHTGTAAELDAYVKDVEKIVRQEGANLRRVFRVRTPVTTPSSRPTCRTATATAWNIANSTVITISRARSPRTGPTC